MHVSRGSLQSVAVLVTFADIFLWGLCKILLRADYARLNFHARNIGSSLFTRSSCYL